jgi:hypothetical protein
VLALSLAAALAIALGPMRHVGPLVEQARADDSGGKGDSGGSDDGGHDGSESGSGGSGADSGNAGSGDSGGGEAEGDGGSSATQDQGTSDGTKAGIGAAGEVGGQHGGRAEPGEIIVLADRPDILAKAQRLGFSLIDRQDLAALDLSVLHFKTPGNIDGRQALALLHDALPRVTADGNSLYAPFTTQSDQVVSLPEPDYARRMIGWSGSEACGAGLRIGMIDTAPGASPALDGQKVHAKSFLADDAAPADGSHGAAVASLLVGRSLTDRPGAAGLMPAADLFAAGVFERDQAQSEASALAIAKALNWMAANHVAVVNISLSGEANDLLGLAISHAAARGTVLVAAAGNGGPDAPPAYPAAFPDVIAATAVDSGDRVYAKANHGDYIAFAAPGVRVWAPEPDALGQYFSGTSLAAPFVAATAALEMMDGASADPAEIRRRLAARAVDLGAPGKDPVFGYGLVRAGPGCGASAAVQ